jgi:VanZ family protein
MDYGPSHLFLRMYFFILAFPPVELWYTNTIEKTRLGNPGNTGPLPMGRITIIQKLVKYWLPVISWMGFIFWFSTEPFSDDHTTILVQKILPFLFPAISPEAPILIHMFLRKAAHVTEYFVLSLLLFRALRGGSGESWNWRWSFFSLGVVVFWAAIDELHQSFVPARTASIVDVGIDLTGGILAQVMIAIGYRYRKK